MKKWSLREDYIVCKFCEEHKQQFIEDALLDEVINILETEWCPLRSSNAVQKRARYYLLLALGQDAEYIPAQVHKVYNVLANEQYTSDYRETLKAYLAQKNSNTFVDGEIGVPGESINSLTHMVHTPKGRRFIDVLEDFIQESQITPKSSIYRDIGMKQNTSVSIRQGKYATVSRENIFRICFGLRLDFDKASLLMKSCGISLRDNEAMDTVVEYHLKQGPTKLYKGIHKYDCELIDIDLLDSGAKTLFSEW